MGRPQLRVVPPTLSNEDRWNVFGILTQKAIELEVLAERADASPLTSKTFRAAIRRDATHIRELADRVLNSKLES